MGHHAHLTLQEREDIMVMRREGKGVTQIAGAIGRSKSTVSRELGRNMCAASTPRPYYRASTAQARYEQRRRACVRPRILDDPGTFELVRGKFLCVWQEFCRHIGMSESTLWHQLMLTVLPDAGW